MQYVLKNPDETDNFIRRFGIQELSPEGIESLKRPIAIHTHTNKVSRELPHITASGPDGFKINSTNISKLNDQITPVLPYFSDHRKRKKFQTSFEMHTD